MPTDISKQDILDALADIAHPQTGQGLVASGKVQNVIINNGNIGLTLQADSDKPELGEELRQQCEERLRTLPGIASISIVLADKTPADKGTGLHTGSVPRKPPSQQTPAIFADISSVIAIASGKGGVGKSTLAVNLAAALARQGHKTGLLDADIYGPSMPQLLGISDRPELNTDKKLIPIDKYGLLAMSIGFMVDKEKALVWRGPMVQQALLQMLNDVAWPSLDLLIIDLPPGTGDVQLTMIQQIPLTGALVVTTPHLLAIADVRRSIAMFQKTKVPVLGVIENMAWLQAPDGSRMTPFGTGGGKAIADETGSPWLGQLPLDADLQKAAASGQPITHYRPESAAAQAFDNLATLFAKTITLRETTPAD